MNNIKVYEEPNEFGGGTHLIIHEQKVLDSQARIAVDLVKHLAIATAMPDGEDSAGRQRLRLMDPELVASRACDIASLLWKEFTDRQWLVDSPEFKPRHARPPRE